VSCFIGLRNSLTLYDFLPRASACVALDLLPARQASERALGATHALARTGGIGRRLQALAEPRKLWVTFVKSKM
jgi:hypothetical protein